MKNHFSQLQKQYPVFSYLSYSYEVDRVGLHIAFNFELGEHKFVPKLVLKGVKQSQLDSLGKVNVDNFVFHLGLAEIPSYWKLSCSPLIRIQAGHIDAMQQGFWKKLIEKGMGEFYFVNDIVPFAPEIEVTYSNEDALKRDDLPAIHSAGKVLLPVGGGKDSIVSTELLQKAGQKIVFFTIGKDQASEDIISVFQKNHGETDRVEIERIIDPKLLELNARGFLNGHTPFSSIVAFNSVFAATIFRLPFVVLSNERSANEETGVYHGVNINHQYSKTFEFESDFRSYMQQTFPGASEYFSLLRPLYEIQIMEIFSRFPQYFGVFRSCNIGKKTNSWCGACAKCLFVYLLLSAFLPAKEVESIFGKDLFSDETLIPVLKQLTGDAVMKAFECVGTRAETMSALYLAYKRRKDEVVPPVIGAYKEYLDNHAHALDLQAKELLGSFDQNHFIPESFLKVVTNAS